MLAEPDNADRTGPAAAVNAEPDTAHDGPTPAVQGGPGPARPVPAPLAPGHVGAPAAGFTVLDPALIRWGGDGSRPGGATVTWLWDGYLAAGNLTLLTSQAKAGKTTLLAHLLGRVGSGGLVAGRHVRAGKAVVLSEETEQEWDPRRRQLGIGASVCCICRPLRGKPTPEQWRGLIADLRRLWTAQPFDLVVIDTLSSFLPAQCENNADRLLEALAALRELSDLGLSVWLVHHPAKGHTPDGQAARGTGAFAGHADVVIEMKHYTRASDQDRRRRLFAYSRYPATPRQLVIELSADGTDYLAQGDLGEAEFLEAWPALCGVLEQAADRVTRGQVLAQWPEALVPPDRRILARWLEEAVARGLVSRRGLGRKADPFRYWLPGREEQWRQDPAWCAKESRRQCREEIEREILHGRPAPPGGRP
jgi:hypothetical protein